MPQTDEENQKEEGQLLLRLLSHIPMFCATAQSCSFCWRLLLFMLLLLLLLMVLSTIFVYMLHGHSFLLEFYPGDIQFAPPYKACMLCTNVSFA